MSGKRYYRITPHGQRQFEAIMRSITEIDEIAGRENYMSDPQRERWRVKYRPLTLGSYYLIRGDYLDDEAEAELDKARNRQALIDSFLVRQRPPSDWQPVRRAAPAAISASYVQPPAPSWVDELAAAATANSWCWQLATAVQAAAMPFAVAIDKPGIVPSDLLKHSLKEYADLKKPITGNNNYRASVEHFPAYMAAIISRIKQTKRVAA